jgi:DNA-binding CsgD family transcriptional regulator
LRTGVAFRIALADGRQASLNFYSAYSQTAEALETALGGLFLIGHRVHHQLQPRLAAMTPSPLSSREAECLRWIALGRSNKEIAQALGLSSDTVKEHLHSLYLKLKVGGRAQAVSRAYALSYLT